MAESGVPYDAGRKTLRIMLEFVQTHGLQSFKCDETVQRGDDAAFQYYSTTTPADARRPRGRSDAKSHGGCAVGRSVLAVAARELPLV